MPVRSSLTFGDAVARVFSHGIDFTGRAARPEYWWFVLFKASIALLVWGIDVRLMAFAVLVMAVPHVAVAVRRMHDTGRSGAWVFWLVGLPQVVVVFGSWVVGSTSDLEVLVRGVMIMGMIYFVDFALVVVAIVLLASPGNQGANRYGPAPR